MVGAVLPPAPAAAVLAIVSRHMRARATARAWYWYVYMCGAHGGAGGGRDAAGVAAPARRLPRAAWSRFCAAAVVLRREETERRDFCSFNGLRLNSEAVMICRDGNTKRDDCSY